MRPWSEVGGMALPANGSGQNGFLLRTDATAPDGTLEMDLVADIWNGHRGGAVFRYTNQSSFYFVGVRPANQWESHVFFCVDGMASCSPLGKKDVPLASNVNLRIVMHGNEFKVFLNGDSVATINDATHATGRVGYGHSAEWNRLCSFDRIQWTETTQQSSSLAPSLAQSSSSVASSSGIFTSSSSAKMLSSASLGLVPMPVVTASVIGSNVNWYAVALTVKNAGTVPLDAPEIGWHFNWADHSDELEPEIDHSSLAGVTGTVEARDDFSGTVWMRIPVTLNLGDSAVVHLRMHVKDYTAINRTNDPSWIAMPTVTGGVNNGVTVRRHAQNLVSEIPRLPFPTTAKQEAKVNTTVTQRTDNTLWLTCLVTNTGEVPLRRVRFNWHADTLAGEQPLIGLIDWSQVPGTTISRTTQKDRRVQFTVALGEGLLPIGATREVQVRIASKDWGNVNFTDDWSWAGTGNTAGNPKVTVTSDGLIVYGQGPWTNDSDGDGIPDAVERQVGSDPHNANDAPLVGVPDRVDFSGITKPEYVEYRFDQIPGYGTRTRIAVSVAPGTLVNNEVPTIRYLGNESGKPELLRRDFLRSGGYFQVHADIAPGSTIEMALPMPDYQPKRYSKEQVKAFRFDSTAQEWQALEIKSYDGAVHVVTSKFSPAMVGVTIMPRSISAGDSHVVVLDSLVENSTTHTRVLSFGSNGQGRLGFPDPGRVWSDSLIQVMGVVGNVRSVAAGARHSLALMVDGTVMAWGDNREGQLGNSNAGDSSDVPVKVVFPVGIIIKDIVAGTAHNIAIDESNRTWVWGRGDEGQLGLASGSTPLVADGSQPELLTMPAEGENTVRLFAVAAGRAHSLGLDSLQRLWTWGANDRAQLLIPQGVCSDLSWDYKPGTARTGCTYGSDQLTHAIGRRTFQGFMNTYENPSSSITEMPVSRLLASGRDFGVSHRLRPAQTVVRTVWWGTGMTGLQSGASRLSLMSAGISHFATMFEGGFLSPYQHPLSDGYHFLNTVEDPDDPENTQYLYQFNRVDIYGDNSTGALGDANPLKTATSVQAWGARDLAAGYGYTALWYPDSAMEKMVKVYGKIGSKDFGAGGGLVGYNSGTIPSITITSPTASVTKENLLTVAGSLSPKASQVKILIDGELKETLTPTGAQTSFSASLDISALQDGSHEIEVLAIDGGWGRATKTFVVDRTPPVVVITSPTAGEVFPVGSIDIPVSGTVDGVPFSETITPALPAGSFAISKTASDAVGNTTAETVNVILAALTVSNVVVTGALEYPAALADATKRVSVSLDLNMTAEVTLKIRNLDNVVVCIKALGAKTLGTSILHWDGMCDDLKWVPEGVHYLDVSVARYGVSAEIIAPAMTEVGASSIVYWPIVHNVLKQAEDSLSPDSGQIVVVRAFVGSSINNSGAYYVFGGNPKWGYRDASQVWAREVQNSDIYKVSTFRSTEQTIFARVLPPSPEPNIGNLRGESLHNDIVSIALGLGWKARMSVDGSISEVDYEENEAIPSIEWWPFKRVGNVEWILREQKANIILEYWWEDGVTRSFVRCMYLGEKK